MVLTKLEKFGGDSGGLSSTVPWSMKDLAVKNLRSIEIVRGIISRTQEEQGGTVWRLKGAGTHNNIKYSLDFGEDSEVALNATTYTKKIVRISDIDTKKSGDDTKLKFAVHYQLKNQANFSDPRAYLESFKQSILNWKTDLDTDATAKMPLPVAESWLSFLLCISYRPCVVFYGPHSRGAGGRITLEEYVKYHNHRYRSTIKECITDEEVVHYADERDEEDSEKTKHNLVFPKSNLPFTSEITAMNMSKKMGGAAVPEQLKLLLENRDNHDEFRDLSWVDFIRLQAISLMSRWLQDALHNNDPITLAILNEKLQSSELLCLEDRASLFSTKLQKWIETKDLKMLKWRDVVRKFNLRRESSDDIYDHCETLFGKRTTTNGVNMDAVAAELIVKEADYVEKKPSNLLPSNPIAEMTPDADDKLENKNRLLVYRAEIDKRTNTKIAVNKFITKYLNININLNSTLDLLQQQYCKMFPFDLTPTAREEFGKKCKAYLKWISKDGLNSRSSLLDDENINMVEQLSRNHLYVQINTYYLGKQGKCLFHPINLMGSCHNKALSYFKYKFLNKFRIDSAIEEGSQKANTQVY